MLKKLIFFTKIIPNNLFYFQFSYSLMFSQFKWYFLFKFVILNFKSFLLFKKLLIFIKYAIMFINNNKFIIILIKNYFILTF